MSGGVREEERWSGEEERLPFNSIPLYTYLC